MVAIFISGYILRFFLFRWFWLIWFIIYLSLMRIVKYTGWFGLQYIQSRNISWHCSWYMKIFYGQLRSIQTSSKLRIHLETKKIILVIEVNSVIEIRITNILYSVSWYNNIDLKIRKPINTHKRTHSHRVV